MLYRVAMAHSEKPLSPAQIELAERVLSEAPFGYLAMVDHGGPYVIPLNFVYVRESGPGSGQGGLPQLDGRIYFHTGEGRKADALAADPRVCMAFTARAAFAQGDTPCGDGFSFQSLLVWGRARVVEDEPARERFLRAIVVRYDPAAIDAPFNDDVFAQTLIYEVSIEAAGYKQRPK